MTKRIALCLLVISIIGLTGGGVWAYQRSIAVTKSQTAMKDHSDKMADKPVSPVLETTQNTASSRGAAGAGEYLPYDSAKLANAKTGKVVIFFAASWCPECRALNADITAHMSAIPTRLTILKADFDTELKLRQKYGVTYQHTLVQVDEAGNLLHKWSGSSTLADVVGMVI